MGRNPKQDAASKNTRTAIARSGECMSRLTTPNESSPQNQSGDSLARVALTFLDQVAEKTHAIAGRGAPAARRAMAEKNRKVSITATTAKPMASPIHTPTAP